MKSVMLLLGLWWVHQASGATHSLKYFYTASSNVPSFPEFVAVGLVDEVQFLHFDSNSQQAVAKQDWLNKMAETDPQYFQRQTQGLQGTHQTFRANIDIAKQRFNQTGGMHTFQFLVGCQWDDVSKATNGFHMYGYDGGDFISLDLNTMQYIAPVNEAIPTKHKWENLKGDLDYWKNYLTHECVDWLKKYVQYGHSSLERKDRPQVSLLEKGSSMACHATGFYPEGVMITWKKDGGEVLEDLVVGETLPNDDGTFQKRVVLKVSPDDRTKGVYTCEVEHSSGETIVVQVENGGNLPVIIAVSVIAVVVGIGAAIIIGVMMKKKGYKRTNQSDTESDASSGTPKA